MFLDEIKNCEVVDYKRGDSIVNQGDDTEYVYYILNGICYRVISNENGNEQIISIRTARGDISSVLGLLTLLNNRETYSCSFRALTDCKCYKIHSKKFFDIIYTDIHFLHQAIAFSTSENIGLIHKLTAHSESSVSNFLCCLIYQLSIPAKDGKYTLPREYTIEFLSKMIGVTNVTVARIIGSLKSAGVLSREKGKLFINDMHEFENYCNGKVIKYGK